eukprot:TRINITY_DN1143_c0_g1_i1.p1 TRINITY_DN1143_c0_g1~~TRINITY_DN1143_c0_g1_i1.p1  ORF type:complete len:328 (-),score=91.00 TRINITY_DN1143_c0_g1_i1:1158-2141(-)
METKESKKRPNLNEPVNIHPQTREEQVGRKWTISIALPGSIIDNVQSRHLRAYVAGQIGRALAIFNIDEVIIFGDPISRQTEKPGKWNSCSYLTRILEYLETPQFLRKTLFPVHPDLRDAGLLNPLDTPHHMRMSEWTPYRDGVVLDRPIKAGEGSLCECGLLKNVRVDKELRPNTRVTVKMLQETAGRRPHKGKLVSSAEPREKYGVYWGYQARNVENFHEIFTKCPYEGGYDMTLGTSDTGENIDNPDFELQPFRHLLIVFGGLAGLEEVVAADRVLDINEEDTKLLFDKYLNVVPSQGSRTIRTEEAIPIALAALRPHFHKNGK